MRIKRNPEPDIGDRIVTAQRQLILDILRDSRSHLDAKELYQQASAKDRQISLATVYRNLRLFRDMGIVDEVRLDELHCYYELRKPRKHYHLLCTCCGKVFEFDSPLVVQLIEEIERNEGFCIKKAALHLEGECPGCKESER